MIDVIANNVIVEAVARAWYNLDASIMEPYLADNMRYSSQWVLSEMHSKEEYLNYIRGKFATLERSGCKPDVKVVEFNNGVYDLILSQNGDVWLTINTSGFEIKSMNMSDVRFMHSHILVNYDPSKEPELKNYPINIGDEFFHLNNKDEVDYFCRVDKLVDTDVFLSGCRIGKKNLTDRQDKVPLNMLVNMDLERCKNGKAFEVYTNSSKVLSDHVKSAVENSMLPNEPIQLVKNFVMINRQKESVYRIYSPNWNENGDVACDEICLIDQSVVTKRSLLKKEVLLECIALKPETYEKIIKLLDLSIKSDEVSLGKVFGYKLAIS